MLPSFVLVSGSSSPCWSSVGVLFYLDLTKVGSLLGLIFLMGRIPTPFVNCRGCLLTYGLLNNLQVDIFLVGGLHPPLSGIHPPVDHSSGGAAPPIRCYDLEDIPQVFFSSGGLLPGGGFAPPLRSYDLDIFS